MYAIYLGLSRDNCGRNMLSGRKVTNMPGVNLGVNFAFKCPPSFFPEVNDMAWACHPIEKIHWSVVNFKKCMTCMMSSIPYFCSNLSQLILFIWEWWHIFTEYQKNCLNNLDILTIQNLWQYISVAKFEKLSSMESITTKKLRPNEEYMKNTFWNLCALALWLASHIFATQCWQAPIRAKQLSTVGILLYRCLSCWCNSISLKIYCQEYMPVIRWDVAMVTALIKKTDNQSISP